MITFLQNLIGWKKNKKIKEIELQSKHIMINPLNDLAYFNRGMAKIKLRDFVGALSDFNKAIELDPTLSSTLAELYFERGKIKQRLKDVEGALQDFKYADIVINNLTIEDLIATDKIKQKKKIAHIKEEQEIIKSEIRKLIQEVKNRNAN